MTKEKMVIMCPKCHDVIEEIEVETPDLPKGLNVSHRYCDTCKKATREEIKRSFQAEIERLELLTVVPPLSK
ncbi:hypothetical protein COU05_00100 [bacterium (Candidatus Gribaldobacteria) CG10_big_fil_rev_8_21_14_0_10_37_21]|uniref:Uncharacterized protein n=1 Tax=bacterium (Candidatus Gribaldobacteria) CG10_big_fil_rev_8_21_14_0_10_37_21 TaxID=2014275 RepID=A0A2H0UVE2_9BACT|nr:MAG: hypothetical protein AUJ25_00870 [Parcubacteria group bacterium CG1_02_37_13]PIR90777.1 MAG: hypothetical protein COU05_00100 [bacterium (Candidatus Gribaldobacteria) CG10_big_fil_rev_8_21_14_0_10_37_21]